MAGIYAPMSTAPATMADDTVVAPTQLAPRCARSSLKRARLLFNDGSSVVDVPPSLDASSSIPTRDKMMLMSSYIPPMYDRDGSTNRTNISRRVKLTYNTNIESLAFHNFDPSSSSGEGGNNKSSKKETATVRALREISDMASERIRLGLGPIVTQEDDTTTMEEERDDLFYIVRGGTITQYCQRRLVEEAVHSYLQLPPTTVAITFGHHPYL